MKSDADLGRDRQRFVSISSSLRAGAQQLCKPENSLPVKSVSYVQFMVIKVVQWIVVASEYSFPSDKMPFMVVDKTASHYLQLQATRIEN